VAIGVGQRDLRRHRVYLGHADGAALSIIGGDRAVTNRRRLLVGIGNKMNFGIDDLRLYSPSFGVIKWRNGAFTVVQRSLGSRIWSPL